MIWYNSHIVGYGVPIFHYITAKLNTYLMIYAEQILPRLVVKDIKTTCLVALE